ncbi:hypothetical protein [Streptomyces chartreusis]
MEAWSPLHAELPLREPFRKLQLVWAGADCTRYLVNWTSENIGLILEVVERRDDSSGFACCPRRRVVERSFARLARREAATRQRRSPGQAA